MRALTEGDIWLLLYLAIIVVAVFTVAACVAEAWGAGDDR
jgi:hypothetical protein